MHRPLMALIRPFFALILTVLPGAVAQAQAQAGQPEIPPELADILAPLFAISHQAIPTEYLGLDHHIGAHLTADDGVDLSFSYVLPAPRLDGQLAPAVLFINPFAGSSESYQFTGLPQALARRGYVVMLLTARGFAASGGDADFAGPRDIKDVGLAIDWLLANTPTDPARIGITGLSYGAGVAIMAGTADPRLKTVVSMNGWTDLLRNGIMADHSISAFVFDLLIDLATVTKSRLGRGETLKKIVFTDPDDAGLRDWAQERSIAYHRRELEARQLPIFFVHTINDTFFRPNFIDDFYLSVHTPKRLSYYLGTHGIDLMFEQVGRQGAQAEILAWFDEQLVQAPDAPKKLIDQPISLPVRNVTPVAATSPTERRRLPYQPERSTFANFALALPAGHDAGALALLPVAAPATSFAPNADANVTTASTSSSTRCQDESPSAPLRWLLGAGLPSFFVGLEDAATLTEGLTGVPVVVFLDKVDPNHTVRFDWRVTTSMMLAGRPHLELPVCSRNTRVQISAYLFSRSPGESAARLVTQAYGAMPVASGAAVFALDFNIGAYALRAGDVLSLVVDTKDTNIYESTGQSPDVALMIGQASGLLSLELAP